MSNLAIPSKTVLFQKEKAIRSIQELYEHVSKLEDSGGGYIKPEDGIPASDMTEEVQESLAKADSALQQHQDISGKVDKTTTVNGHALSSNVTVTKGDVGLGNVTNAAQIPLAQKGANNGVATLGSTGKIPTNQLPDAIMTGNNNKYKSFLYIRKLLCVFFRCKYFKYNIAFTIRQYTCWQCDSLFYYRFISCCYNHFI